MALNIQVVVNVRGNVVTRNFNADDIEGLGVVIDRNDGLINLETILEMVAYWAATVGPKNKKFRVWDESE